MKWPGNEQYLYLCNILVSRWVNSGKDISTYEPRNILCIKWDEIGDMAACTHVFALLRKKFPNAQIDVIAKDYSAKLIEFDPHISNVYTRIDQWNKKYDFVIEFRGTWKTLFRTFRYYPKVRLDRGLVRFKNKGNQLHETITNYQIIKPIIGEIENQTPDIYIPEKSIEKVNAFLNKNAIDSFALFHTGARRELRRWKPERFAEIADWLHKEKGLGLVFAGTEVEEKQIAEITEKMHVPFHLFTREFSLTDLAAIMQKATLFVGNESGPLQMADALKLRSLGLFGPGVPKVFYPQYPQSATLHYVLDCNPCDQVHCVRPQNPCIDLIEVAEVKAVLTHMLS